MYKMEYDRVFTNFYDKLNSELNNQYESDENNKSDKLIKSSDFDIDDEIPF